MFLCLHRVVSTLRHPFFTEPGEIIMLSNQEVSQLVESIWSATVDLTVDSVDSFEMAPNQDRLTGCVHITGGWNGALTLDCSATLAREASARLFEIAPSEASMEDIHDTLCEITNMTGGNLKALLSQGSEGALQLSLPSVTEGKSYRLALPGTRKVFEAFFEVGGEPMVVTLFVADPSGSSRQTASSRR